MSMPGDPQTNVRIHREDNGTIVVAFGACMTAADLVCSITGLREHAHLAWIRSRPEGGGLFRGACDPVLIASRTPPGRIDKAAVKNWLVADYDLPTYSKPPQLLEYIMGRVVRRGDLVLDPFSGSGSSRTACENLHLDLDWRGCDIDKDYAEGRS